MSPDAWAFAGTVVITSGGWVTVLLQQKRHSRAVVKHLTPNGNKPLDEGGTIADSLGRLESSVGGLRSDVSAVQASFLAHLTQHAGGQQ
jgi:hypothetical protein